MSGGRLSNISPTQNCAKVFVQRDYSLGTIVRFQTQLPDELEDKIERSTFEYTVNQLNAFFEEAESSSCKTYCQGCCACLTAYLMFICVESHYEKCLKKIARFIVEQNEKVYIPRGLLLVNPAERGLRVFNDCDPMQGKAVDPQQNLSGNVIRESLIHCSISSIIDLRAFNRKNKIEIVILDQPVISRA